MGSRGQDASNAKTILQKTKELDMINALTQTLKEDRKEYMGKINELLLEFRRSMDIQISPTMKGNILKWLLEILEFTKKRNFRDFILFSLLIIMGVRFKEKIF